MPKAKVETVLSDTGGWKKISVAVGQPDGTSKDAIYTCFSTFETLANAVLEAKADAASAVPLRKNLLGEDSEGDPQESEQALILRLVNASIDRMARSMAYEAAAQQSTLISTGVGDEKTDIMNFPLTRLLRGINGEEGGHSGRCQEGSREGHALRTVEDRWTQARGTRQGEGKRSHWIAGGCHCLASRCKKTAQGPDTWAVSYASHCAHL